MEVLNFWVSPIFLWTHFTENILAPYNTIFWGYGGTPIQNWPVLLGGPYRNVSIPWCGAIYAYHAYMLRSPDNARAAARRVHDDFLHDRRRALMWITYTSRNPVQNPRINRRVDDWEGPVDQ